MNQTQIDYSYIESTLRAAGWGVVEGSSVLKEFSVPQEKLSVSEALKKTLKADYVLQFSNTNLAVVEAINLDRELSGVIYRAREYSKLLGIPYTFSTNGKQFYEIDMKWGKKMGLSVFPGPVELWKRFAAEG